MLEQLREAAGRLPRRWIQTDPGLQLRLLRETRGISRRQLAHQVGIDPSDVSRIERGADARLSTWRRLFAALGWEAVLVPADECDETVGLLEAERDRRMERQAEGLMAGKRRFG